MAGADRSQWLETHTASPKRVALVQVRPLKMEEEMAPHSSVLAWKTPWTEECGGHSPEATVDVNHHVH